MLARLASFSFRRRWFVLLAWIAALVVATLANGAFGGEWRSSARLDGTDSQRAYDIAEKHFPAKTGGSATVVFAAPRGVTAQQSRITNYLSGLTTISGVEGVTSPFEADGQISEDGTIAFATVDLSSDSEISIDAASSLIDKAKPLRDDGVQVEFSGWQFSEGELPASELFGLLAAAIILLIAFGSIVAAGLPIVTAIVGVGIGLASVGLWASFVDTPDFTVQVASMIGIGVGIDYALFLITRVREARGRGKDAHAAVMEAAATAGRAVVFAGLTVMTSLLGMVLMRLKFLNGLAIGTSTAVAVSVAAAITLLPALMGFARKRIKPIAPTVDNQIAARGPTPHALRGTHEKLGFWVRWTNLVQRNPGKATVVGVVSLLLLSAPTLALRMGSADDGSAPKDQTTRKAYDLLAQGFTPGFAGPFLLIGERPASGATAEPSTRETTGVEQFVGALRKADGVAFASDPQTSADGRAVLITVIPTTAPQDENTDRLLHRIRSELVPSATATSGIAFSVGGVTASDVDFAEFVSERLPWFIGAVLAISFLLLLAMFRSVLVPLKAVVLNLLSIGAAYGVMVAVFQWGWFGSLFGVGKGAPIEPWAPMMLFAIVFGLSMDYEVFLLSNIRERFLATGNNSTAVARGVSSTARVISAAAAIMVFVFGFFVFGSAREIKLIGLGLATAVFIDATIVRLLLVPSTMELLGNKNWWMPRWLDRIIPSIRMDEHAADEPTAPAITPALVR